MPVLWVKREQLKEVLSFLRGVAKPYSMLYDLHGVDERLRTQRRACPPPTSACSTTCCRSSVTAM